MKKLWKGALAVTVGVLCTFGISLQAQAEEADQILPGIYADTLSLGGQSEEQAVSSVEAYVAALQEKQITLRSVNENEVVVTAKDLGLVWSNPEIIDEAVEIGKSGNIVHRYKEIKDLEHESVVLPLHFDFDQSLISQILAEQCAVFNVEAVDATLTRQDDAFVVQEGQTGCVVDEQDSLNLIYQYLVTEWNKDNCSIELTVATEEPKGTREELSKVKDVLGSFSTSFATSSKDRSANVSNGCYLINGTTLYPGDEFSVYDAVAPFTSENGYYMAGAYLNGQVVDSIGGGICQVSTTLYNAVLLAELDITERHNHSMIVSYVDPSADAAISESAGKDFRFSNTSEYPVYIEGYTTDEKQIFFTIYGVETRSPSRVVTYESEVVSKKYPETETIYADGAQPVGYVSVQSAHIGYKANLWKVVTENGEEVSREMVNSSSYAMSPRSAIVGVATADPNAYNEIIAAISTNNIDHVKGVAAALAATAAPAEQTAPAAPVEQEVPAALVEPAEQPAE